MVNLNIATSIPAPLVPLLVDPPIISTTTNSPIIHAPSADSRLKTTITNRQPRDFFFIRVLGEGSFSTVYYAKEVDTGDDYAIKVLLKSQIRREDKVRYVIREKDIMATLTYAFGGHPFVAKLYCTFQDRDRLCELGGTRGRLGWL